MFKTSLFFPFSDSHEPAEDDPECSGEARPQHPQRGHGRQQPDEAAADREGTAATQATGAAPAEAAGQELGFSKKASQTVH